MRHPPRRGGRGARELPRRRLRRRRDQLLRRHAAGAGRVRPRRPRPRAQRRGRAHRPRRLRPPRPRRRPAALRLRLDGADHQGDLGHRRHHLRRARGALPGAGPGADGRRRRLPAARDRPGHPQHQGRADRHRARRRRGGVAAAGGGVGDHRGDRHHAGRPGRRGAGGGAAPRRPPVPGTELRHRPRADGRPRAHAVRAGAHAGRGGAQRRPPRRGRPLWRDARGLLAGHRALPRRRLAQPGGRLLRHHRGPRRRPGPRRRRAAATPGPAAPPQHDLRPRGGRARPLQPAAAGRRAHQRAGQPQVQAADPGGRARGGGRGGEGAGAGLGPGAGRLPAGPRPRRDGGHGGVPGPSGAPGQGAADDRLDRRRGDGAGAALVPGQVGAQLDQPRGRPGALRARGAAGAPLRGRGGGRVDRREGHGGHRRAQARGGPAQLPDPGRGDGRPARGHLVGRAGLPLRHRRPGVPGLGGADHRRGARRQGAVPRHQDRAGRLQRQLRAAGGRPRGAQLGLPVPLHQGRAGRGDRQHRGGWRATPTSPRRSAPSPRS